MPEIQEYLPQVTVPEGIGGVSPNTEFSSAFGKSVEHVGGELSTALHYVREKSVQAQTADTYSYFADQRAQQMGNLQEQIQKGTLDVDSFMEGYDNETSQYGDNLSTPESQNFFKRQQSRLRGNLLQLANHGMAQISANEARGNWQNAVNKMSSSLEQDPLSFGDVWDSGQEAVNQLIQDGGLPDKMRGQALQEMGTQFARSALIGQAKTDPDKAMQTLDDGGYDGYLNSQQREQMRGVINSYSRGNEIEQRRAKKAVEDEQKAKSESWGSDHLEALTKNALAPKDILQAVQDKTLTWEQGERWLKLVDEGSKQEYKSNPRIYNQLAQRIVNPDSPNPISDLNELGKFVHEGGISPTDYQKLSNLFARDPEQKALQQSETALFNSAAKTIRFKSMGSLGQQYDPLGENKLAQFKADYIEAKKQIKAQGGSPSDLVNPNNPLYFGNNFQNYQTSLQDQMNHQAQDRTQKALGLKPTGQNPNPMPAKQARKPNETQAQYLKRMGL